MRRPEPQPTYIYHQYPDNDDVAEQRERQHGEEVDHMCLSDVWGERAMAPVPCVVKDSDVTKRRQQRCDYTKRDEPGENEKNLSAMFWLRCILFHCGVRCARYPVWLVGETANLSAEVTPFERANNIYKPKIMSVAAFPGLISVPDGTFFGFFGSVWNALTSNSAASLASTLALFAIIRSRLNDNSVSAGVRK